MNSLNGDVSYTVETEYLVIHTDSGDIMIGIEEAEELHNLLGEMLEYGE